MDCRSHCPKICELEVTKAKLFAIAAELDQKEAENNQINHKSGIVGAVVSTLPDVPAVRELRGQLLGLAQDDAHLVQRINEVREGIVESLRERDEVIEKIVGICATGGPLEVIEEGCVVLKCAAIED